MMLKVEKLQDELNSIDEELFELEKKYGEFKRPVREVVVEQEEVMEEVAQENKTVESIHQEEEEPVEEVKEA